MNAASQPDRRRCKACGAVLDSRRTGEVCLGCALESALEPPAPTSAMPSGPDGIAGISTPAPSSPPGRFGDYELLEEIARGGMGVVFKARQTSLDRLIAVKMLLFGPLASAEAVQRFRTEAAAAASLQHPNIVAVHEVGFRDGQHFIAMDYVAGRSLAEIVRDGPLPARRAAGYMKTIAEAIQYAHQRGILHRDLKPSNVLIDADDQPKVTDFGLAKRLEKDSDLTLSGQVLGSPSYMAPEQAAAHRGLVGKRSDVYSLGAILYHLLTGRAPFAAATVAETLQQVQNAEPVSPTILHPGLPRDLKTICLKCLEKEPARRYQTAQELAEELGRFLDDQPIVARPVSRPEKLWRWCRRKPVVASLSAAVVSVFLAGFVGVFWQWQQSEKHHALAEANLYAADMNLAQQAWEEGDWERAQRLLLAHQPAHGEEDLRGFEWRYLWRLCRDESRLTLATFTNSPSSAQSSQHVYGLAFSPDGKTLAIASGKTVSLWDFPERRQFASFEVPEDDVQSLAFSPTQPHLLAGAAGRTIWFWDVRTREVTDKFSTTNGTVMGIAFSPDGRTLAAANWGTPSEFWDLETKRLIAAGHRIKTAPVELWNLETKQLIQSLPGHYDHALFVAFSPDGKLLVSSGADAARLWNPVTGEQIGPSLTNHGAWIPCVRFSPDGRRLATTGYDSRVLLWDVATFRAGPPLLGHNGAVFFVAFSPDGSTLASAGNDHTIRFWSVDAWRQVHLLHGHRRKIRAVAFSPDGQSLVSLSTDKTVKVWDAVAHLEAESFEEGWVEAVAISPDGTKLATSEWAPATVKLWDLAAHRLITTFRGHTMFPQRIAFTPDGTLLASGSLDGTVRLWDPMELKPVVTNRCDGGANALTFSADGKLVAAAANGVRFWEAGSGRQIRLLNGDTRNATCVAIADSGEVLATSHSGGKITLWDAHDGTERTSFWDETSSVRSLAVSGDGGFVAAGKMDGTVALFDLTQRTNPRRLKGHTAQIDAVRFTPDSKTLASVSRDGTIKFWNPATGQPALTLKQVGPVTDVSFSADGNVMVTSGADGVKVWRAAPLAEANAAAELLLAEDREQAAAAEHEQARRARERTPHAQALRLRDPGAIRQWLVLLPIRMADQDGVRALQQEQVPQERRLRPRDGERVKVGTNELVWRTVRLDDYAIDFNDLAGAVTEYSVAYAVAYVYSRSAQNGVSMRVGCDNLAKVYLNGREIYECATRRSYVPDQDTVTGLELNAGINVVVFKVVNFTSRWEGSLWFTDAAGQPLKGIKVALAPPR